MAATPSPLFSVGFRVMREVRRPGDLLRYRDDSVVALFDDMGYRTLRLELVETAGLLTPADETETTT